MSRHRRRSIALGAVAILLLAFALLGTGGSHKPVSQPMQQVVSIRRPLTAGARITPADLNVSEVPSTWASPHQLNDPAAAVGHRAAIDLPSGAPLMDSELANPGSPPGSRDVSLRLDDAAGLPLDPPDGATADLYLVEPGRAPRVQLVLADALVVASSRSDGASVATLRVGSRDVAALIEAESQGSLRLVTRSTA
ncbi:MAG: Chaperone for flagella basal body P-ring formation [Gaiellales bacterium]|nr:Chaperone for flagella basal body P-ring formation [Gaiellales bacterium]